jgi:5-methylcytosine-specific restriction protein A
MSGLFAFVMPVRPPTFRTEAQKAATERSRHAYEERRASTKPWRVWYKLSIWRGLRRQQLDRQPLCELCLKELGICEPATVVHHKRSHQGDWSLFADADNLQSVCQPHHDRDLQAEEAAARSPC